jgi:hypothetical protein
MEEGIRMASYRNIDIASEEGWTHEGEVGKAMVYL